MPTYVFKCKNCNTQFDKFQKISDPYPDCPECGGQVGKQLTAPALNIRTELVPGGTIVKSNFMDVNI